jgi:Tfp pilus assembly protein PilE
MENKLNRTKLQDGFGLVEIMIAFALLGALSLFVTQLMENQNKNQKTMEVKADFLEVFNLFAGIMTNKEACKATIADSLKGTNIQDFYMNKYEPTAEPFATAGEPFQNGKLMVESMRILTDQEAIDKKATVAGGTPEAGDTFVFVEVKLKRISAKQNYYGADTKTKIYTVPVVYGEVQSVWGYDYSMAKLACTDAPLLGKVINGDGEEGSDYNDPAEVEPAYFDGEVWRVDCKIIPGEATKRQVIKCN